MENGLCFGKRYSGGATECLLCEVREECMIAMLDEKKMPCWKQYDPENYACRTACHLGGEPDVSVCAAATYGAEDISDESTEVGSMAENVAGQQPTDQGQVAETPAEAVAETPAEAVAETPAEAVAEAPAEAVAEAPAEAVAETPDEDSSSDSSDSTEASVEDTGTTVSPDAVQAAPAKPGKKKSKKDVIRDALAESPEGIAADDIVTKIMDAGLATEAEMDKTRHYVIMSISHLRRAGKQIELREGKYVQAGDPSE